jgi:hypothetical protein
LETGSKRTYDIGVEWPAAGAQQNRDSPVEGRSLHQGFASSALECVTNQPQARLFMGRACTHRPWGTQPMRTTTPGDDRPRQGRHLPRPPASPHRPDHGHRQPLRLLAARLVPLDAAQEHAALDALAVLLADDESHDDGGHEE